MEHTGNGSGNVINVHVISKELIKPSSPTPLHLKHLKLSLLDQMSPPIYITAVFFYETHELEGLMNSSSSSTPTGWPAQVICQHLKQSLSNTLTLFYPLAGTLDPDNFAVDCDDNGVEFVEAQAHGLLTDIINNPKLDQLHQYLPVDPLRGIYVGEGTLFMVQINFFDCGGIAVGACISHLIADGSSLVEFMNAWAATCRGDKPKSAPQFGAMARYFPPRDLSDSNVSPSLIMGNDKLVTKRFVFDKEKLAALKEAATRSDFVKNPSRVEVVSAFIWKSFIENIRHEEANKKLAVLHIVNIRSRASRSLDLANAFGNGFFTSAPAFVDEEVAVPQLHELVSKLRSAIRTIDEEYIRKTQCADRYLSDLGEFCDRFSKGEVEWFMFSSWCRFPMYDVDFGWGVPVWACTTALLLNNLAILMSSRSGDEIEAWINLLPDNIESLENQFKLIGTSN